MSRDYTTDLFVAIGRGMPALSGTLKVISYVLAFAAFISLLTAATVTDVSDERTAKAVLGIVLFVGTLGFAIVPFHGQRAITKGKEGELAEAQKRLKYLQPLEVKNRAQLDNPRSYLLPYVHQVNGYAMLRNGDNFLDITVSFPNEVFEDALNFDLTGSLYIGTVGESAQFEHKQFRVFGVGTIPMYWKATFTENQTATLKGIIEKQNQITVKADVWAVGQRDKYHWSTEEWTVNPLR